MTSNLLPSSAIFSTLSTPTIIAFSIAIVSLTALWLFQQDPLDPKEPPLAHTRIPILGHMINLLRHQNAYFRILHTTQPHPITTLRIFSQRIYIISSPALAQSALRATKTIDFESLKQHASCKAINFNAHATAVVHAPPDPARGNSCYMMDLHTEMYGALAQGPSLLETNRRVLNCLARSLDEVGAEWEVKGLFGWLRTFYTTGSAEALYGWENPIRGNEQLVPLIWDFEKDLGLLVLDFFPAVTARKGHRARQILSPAFEKYYDAGLDVHASGFVQGRARCARRWGLTTEDISKAEISILFAAVTNTVPNVFFMLCWIFSDPDLLTALRGEVQGIVTRRREEGEERVVLSIGRLREECPLLAASFQETLRLVKTGASVRTVLADTLLGGEYLLKKGAIVQIPTGVLQADTQTWGADAKAFNPARWLDSAAFAQGKGARGVREERKVQGQAYLPFGGGKNLCPGRNLAFNEIAAFVAMVVWGFEVERKGGGVVRVPAVEGGMCNLGDGSTSPRGEVDVQIRRRKGLEGVRFVFDVGGVEDVGAE